MDRRPASAADRGRDGENPGRPTVASALREQLGWLPRDDADGRPAGLTAGELEQAGVHASAAQIDALVALGILGRRVTAGQARIVWSWDAPAPSDPSAAPAPSAPSPPPAASVQSAPSAPSPPPAASVQSAPSAPQVVRGSRQPDDTIDVRPTPAIDIPPTRATAVGADEFEIDLASDQEHERLLMYRVIVAFEAVVGIVLIRELVPRLL